MSAPSPLRRKGRCQKSKGTIGSPGFVFSGKMNSNVGAAYWPAVSPCAAVGALLRQSSSSCWSAGASGLHSERCTTRIMRVGWLSSPVGAFVARMRARCGWGPVNWVVMPPLGLPFWFSPVISYGVTQRLRTSPVAGSTSIM